MNALSLLMLSFAVGVPGDVVLLDFTATWCGPCQQVKPTVQRLEHEGFPVRAVDVDQDPQLASQYGVTGIPCFVMVVDGREVGRVEGAQSYDHLRSMFASAGYTPGAQIAQASGATAAPPARVEQASSSGPLSPSQRAMAASVRLKIEDSQGNSYGTGTIVDKHGDEALVVTCGHIFRDSGGQGAISVDLFLDGAVQTVQGQLISYDLTSDIGLVAIRPGLPVEAVQIAPPDLSIVPNQAVFSIGCNQGNAPSLQHSRITTVNRFLPPANVQVAGRPVEGRSGGGLFNNDGQLIGICNADIADDNEGYFAALATVQAELDRNNLAYVYQPQTGPTSGSGVQLASHDEISASGERVPDMPGSMPPVSRGSVGVVASADSDTEVICIVRSRSQPQDSPEFYVLAQPSTEFLDQLGREFRNQQGQTPTNLRLQR